jgi:mono/diheme cytochrome c family protein
MNTRHSILRSVGAAAVAAASLAALSGCRGDRTDLPPRQFFPDLDDAPKWKPQAQSEFYADKRTMRPAVPGTVAFSRVSLDRETLTANVKPAWAQTFLAQRDQLLKSDPSLYLGTTPTGKPVFDANGQPVVQYLEKIPVDAMVAEAKERGQTTDRAAVIQALINRGQDRYNIYCAACHGYEGDGKGEVGKVWSYPLPTFHDPKYKDPSTPQGRDGYLFHVARNGVLGPDGTQKMPGYAHALDERDAWAVIAYFRVLQASKSGAINDVPPAERQILERSRPPATPAAAPGGAK